MAARKRKKVEAAVEAEAEDARHGELETLLHEHAVIADRIDALEEMKETRRSRILVLMRDLGSSKHDADAGSASFTQRRSFRVHDATRLAELLPPVQLASLVHITADVYDAATADGIPLDEAVIVGRSESLTVSRARSKAARERRAAHIEESKRQAEARIASLRESFNKSA